MRNGARESSSFLNGFSSCAEMLQAVLPNSPSMVTSKVVAAVCVLGVKSPADESYKEKQFPRMKSHIIHSRICTLLRGDSSDSVGPGALSLGTVFAVAGIVTSQTAIFCLMLFAFNVFAIVFDFGKPQPDPALSEMSYSILNVLSLFLTGIFYLGASKLLKIRWWIKIRFWCLFASVLTAFTGVLAIVAMAYVLSRWSSYIAPF